MWKRLSKTGTVIVCQFIYLIYLYIMNIIYHILCILSVTMVIYIVNNSSIEKKLCMYLLRHVFHMNKDRKITALGSHLVAKAYHWIVQN